MIRIFGYIWLLIRIQVLLTAVKLFTCRFQDYIHISNSIGDKYPSSVEIARKWGSELAAGGGSGTVLIDFDIDEAVFEGDDISLLVGVGSAEGYMETDYVEVNLKTEGVVTKKALINAINYQLNFRTKKMPLNP